jgi:hypothetical protein
MEEKYNIILHTTSVCNYDCSYCDVIKDKKYLSKEQINWIINFININYNLINKFKFFWWEPLIVFEDIKLIIDKTHKIIWNKYEIVTNTSFLNNDIWEYFSKYFELVFFSIDSENKFDYKKVNSFIKKYNLYEKIYFNLIISPWYEDFGYKQFIKLYIMWYKNFNLLPVYYTKIWGKEDLKKLSNIMKKILDKSLIDKNIKLYWFQNNTWYSKSLINESLFINTDLNLYYSDLISTKIW